MITLSDIKELERKNQDNINVRTRLEATIEQKDADLKKKMAELKETFEIEVSDAEQTIANWEMSIEQYLIECKELL